MMARTESRVARWISAGPTSAPFARASSLAFASILRPTARSTSAQLPSSAETSSPFSASGQCGFVQEAPFALRATVAPSSFSPSKKRCQPASTDCGSC
jgi:hypothetical protein